MSSVPVSQRKPSRLEAHHLALALGRSLTDLLSRSLGLSKQKMEARIAQRIRTVTLPYGPEYDAEIQRIRDEETAFVHRMIDRESDRVLDLFRHKFTLYGFTISYWDVLIWSLVAGIVVSFIKGLLTGDE